MCVFVYVCHLANLSQSPGSDKNVAALRGHTLEWNEVRGASVVKPNLLREGGGCRDTQHSSRPGPQNIYVCMCLRVCMEESQAGKHLQSEDQGGNKKRKKAVLRSQRRPRSKGCSCVS